MWKEGLCKLPLNVPKALLLVNVLNSELRNGRFGGVPANTNWKAVILTEVSGSVWSPIKELFLYCQEFSTYSLRNPVLSREANTLKETTLKEHSIKLIVP